MKVQNSQGKTIPLSEVEQLPVEGDGDTAEEILASMPNVPVCKKCSKKAAEVNDDGLCCVCQPPLPRVFPATDENLAAAESSLFEKTPARPSREVETEVHDNLSPRFYAHNNRMRSWDLRKLTPEHALAFRGAVEDLHLAWVRVSGELVRLAEVGFVAKSTPVTRIASKLFEGCKVSILAEKRSDFEQLYSAEQLDSLVVAKVAGAQALLKASDGTTIPVRVIHLEVRS